VRRCELRATLHSILSTCLLTSILLTGCASSPTVSVEEHVGNRSLQWANALMALDYDEALTFMTPSYRSSPRAERFRADFGGSSFWQSAEIKWVKCDEENTPVVGSGDDSNAVIPELAGDAKSDANASESAEECRINTWEDCGHQMVTPTSGSSTMSISSGRCQVRLMLTVMKPPEMSFPMPIPFEVTWLRTSEGWYLYH
jgi:hypothetical protein